MTATRGNSDIDSDSTWTCPSKRDFEQRRDFAGHAARGPLGVEQRDSAPPASERHRHEHADRNPQQPHAHVMLSASRPGSARASRHGLRLPATMITTPATAARPPTIGGTGTCFSRSAVTSTGPMSTTFSVFV